MHTRVFVYMLAGLAIASVGGAAASKAPSWLATGTVTKVDGNTIHFLSKDNVVFRIDAGGAVIVSEARYDGAALRPGDKVRVFGTLIGPNLVRAARIRVLTTARDRTAATGSGPEREVKIVVEKEPAEAAEVASGPLPEPTGPAPSQPEEPCLTYTWQGKGLVTDVDYVGHQVKIQTSDGPFTINTDRAVMVRGTVRVGLGRLNRGDTLWVGGDEIAPNVVDGRMIRVLRTYTDAQNAVPMLPVSVVGVILQIDYPSRTFKMTGRSTWAVISCDDNTVIQFQDIKKTFHDLKPGTKINMSGFGNLTDGYAAQHIQIIGAPQ
jgi:hypothetical protein